MRNLLRIALGALFLTAAFAPLAVAESASDKKDTLQPQAAFEKLKSLSGEWTAIANKDSEAASPHRFEVVSGGHTVMETLFAGSDHSMINMYYLDGGELHVTHYCSMGNQPEMKLNAEASTPSEWVFEFAGGRNLDPDVDAHVHSARISFPTGNRIEAAWEAYQNGQPVGTNLFSLTRERQ